MSWRDTYREYVNLPRNQLISMAINAADGLMCTISAAEGSHRTAKRMLAMLFGGIAVDNGDVAYAEYELYKEVIDLDNKINWYHTLCVYDVELK